jgi:esterase/lipase
MHSKADDFVPVEHMEANRALLAQDRIETYLVERSNHIITCDCDREQVFQVAAAFVNRLGDPS